MSISKIDSLEAVLNEVSGKDRITVLNKLSLLYIRINPEIAYDCAAQSFELAKKINDEEGKADALNNIGHVFRKTYDYDQALENYQLALDIFRRLKSDRDIANVYDNIGHIYWYTGDFSNALDYYTRSLGIFIALEDQKRQSLSYNNLGSVYFRLGLYDESMKNFLNSLNIREKTDDPKIQSTLNNLGNIYVRISDYTKALEMYQRSLEYKRKSNKSTQSTLNNIGNIYLHLEDYECALRYLYEALKINEENVDEKRIAISLNNIAVVYEEQGKIDEALYNYQKALVFKQKVSDKYGYANTSKNLGNIFLLKKDYKQVDYHLEQSLEVAREIKARDVIGDVYELMSERYLDIHDYQKAYLYQNKCSIIRDSLFNEETSERIAQYRTDFTIGKTLHEKEILLKVNQIYKLQLGKDKSFKLILFLFLLIFIMIALFLSYNYNKKKKHNKLLSKANDELEDQVDLRTSELVETNENLRKEIQVRKETGIKLKSSLDEKDVMLKEIHHRVNNNLQIIASILNIQSRSSTNKESLNMFTNTHNRIMSMSLVQEQLYLSDNLAIVDINQYVRSLIINIFNSYSISHSRITPIINIEDVYLNVNTAIPCGLLVNEIVTNAVKHGFNGNKKGEITINMKEDKNNYYNLEISNNGESFPNEIDYKNPESTGMELIRLLILQLSAKVDFVKENGVLYKIKFKKLKN